MHKSRLFVVGAVVALACQGRTFQLVESYGNGYVGAQGNEYGYVQMGPVGKATADSGILASLEQYLHVTARETKAKVVAGPEISGVWQMDRLVPQFSDATIDGVVYHHFGSTMSSRIITNDNPADTMRLVFMTSMNGSIADASCYTYPFSDIYASADYDGGTDSLGSYDIANKGTNINTWIRDNPRYQRHWLLLFEPGTTSDGGRLLTFRGGVEYGEWITAGVPEPGTVAILGMGAAGLLIRRRRVR